MRHIVYRSAVFISVVAALTLAEPALPQQQPDSQQSLQHLKAIRVPVPRGHECEDTISRTADLEYHQQRKPSREVLWSCVPSDARTRSVLGSNYSMRLPDRSQLADALIHAVDARNIGCVVDALAGGADVNDMSTSVSVPRGPALHLALKNYDWPMAAYLMSRGALPQVRDSDGTTALGIIGNRAPDCIILKLASRYFDLNLWADAASLFERLAVRHPGDAAMAWNTALSFDRQGAKQAATAWYAETLARHPHDPNREKAAKARIVLLRSQ